MRAGAVVIDFLIGVGFGIAATIGAACSALVLWARSMLGA
jgi:hypothetical protein